MKKVLFIDRDGTIIEETEDEQIDSFEKLTFLQGAITCLSKIAKETDFELVMVTNQDGLGTPLHPEENFWPVQNRFFKFLRGRVLHSLKFLSTIQCPRKMLRHGNLELPCSSNILQVV